MLMAMTEVGVRSEQRAYQAIPVSCPRLGTQASAWPMCLFSHLGQKAAEAPSKLNQISGNQNEFALARHLLSFELRNCAAVAVTNRVQVAGPNPTIARKYYEQSETGGS